VNILVFVSSESPIQIPTDMIHYGMTKTVQLANRAPSCDTSGYTLTLTRGR
jgi:hypothetical protein